MLKTLQWIYKLGIRNERRRIAAHLQSTQARHQDALVEMERQFGVYRKSGVNSKAEAKDFERIQHKMDVDREVIAIIDSMFTAEERYERGASVVFPEGEE